MSKHTAGPWRELLTRIDDARGYQIAHVDLHGKSEAERDANRRLIAKSPDMHALLSELADYLDVPESAAGGDDTARAYCKRIRELLS